MTSRAVVAFLVALAVAGVPATASAQDEAPDTEPEVTFVEVTDEAGDAVVDEVAPEEEVADESVCDATEGADAVELCEGEAATEDDVSVGTSKTSSARSASRRGWVDGGTVKLSRAGKVTQQLRYRGKLVGTATKTLKKAGTVRLRITLSGAGRKALLAATGPTTLRLRTTRTLRKGKAATSSRTVVLK